MTLIWSLIALAVSGAALLLLGVFNPKRRRTLGLDEAASHRTPLVVLAVIPGLALIVTAQAAAFLIWLGGVVVIGWAVAALLSGRRPARP